jgi:hypothetical protein
MSELQSKQNEQKSNGVTELRRQADIRCSCLQQLPGLIFLDLSINPGIPMHFVINIIQSLDALVHAFSVGARKY